MISRDIILAVSDRTALLIRCSKHEAVEIRTGAQSERRTISNYILNIVMRSVDFEEAFEGRWVRSPTFRLQERALHKDPQRKLGPRTALLVRCTTVEAERIRAAALRKRIMISAYVLSCVRRRFPDSYSGESAPEDPDGSIVEGNR